MVGTHTTRHRKIAELRAFYKFVKLDKAVGHFKCEIQWGVSYLIVNRVYFQCNGEFSVNYQGSCVLNRV